MRGITHGCGVHSDSRCPVLPFSVTPAGFTLIEVLVALFVMAVGLLGLASLQLQGLRGTHDAALRNQAVALATDTAEQLYANRLPGSDVCSDTGCSLPELSSAAMSE